MDGCLRNPVLERAILLGHIAVQHQTFVPRMSVLCRCSIIIRTAIHGWQCLLTTSAKSEKEPRKKTSAIQVDGRPCRVCVVSRKMRSWLAWMSYMTDLAVGRNSSPITFDSLGIVTLDVSPLFLLSFCPFLCLCSS